MSTTGDLAGLQTETRNSRSAEIDNVSTLELCQIINEEDSTVADVVKGCIPTIANAIDALASRLRRGGRVIYVGAGTSGRLGVLDASEIPPTYSAPPSQFVGLIAGGDVSLRSAQEGAEDSIEAAIQDLSGLNLEGDKDSLIGIASSGRTPYVLSSLEFAKSKGCLTIGIACCAPSAMSKSGHVEFMIDAVTGPEVVTGSTRMKAGTATKLVLNMLSSGVMIKIGKTFGNIVREVQPFRHGRMTFTKWQQMVDVKPTNIKLEVRARRILREICGEHCPASDEDLNLELKACGRDVKLTAVKLLLGVSIEEAKRRLQAADGVLSNVMGALTNNSDQVNSNAAVNKYVLCIDGGGSKCRAVIMSADGAVGTGESGPCNPSDIGTDGAILAIKAAIISALQSCSTTRGQRMQQIRFVEAWVGLAGGDREPIAQTMRAAMSKILNGPGVNISVTNDVELIATASIHEFETDDVTILIAGTGSVAMRYRRDSREGNTVRRVGRAGGWGALLGDDGSGFDIGRKAIRYALQQLDEEPLGLLDNAEVHDPLLDVIRKHFQPAKANAQSSNLLSDVLLSASGNEQSASESKRRIASVAKSVIDARHMSSQAEIMVSDAIDSLLSLVRSVQNRARPSGGKQILVLVGGLFDSDSLRTTVIERIKRGRFQFSDIRKVEPSLLGTNFLKRRM